MLMIYDGMIMASVTSSDTGIASHRPVAPDICGNMMNPGIMNTTPLSIINTIALADFSQLW